MMKKFITNMMEMMMKYEDLLTKWVDMECRSKNRQRIEIRDRAREDIAALEREIATLERLVQELRSDRLEETTTPPIKPLTPEQGMKKAERDRERQQRIRDIQASAARKVTDIRTKMGR